MATHPRFRSHVVTARGRGPAGSAKPALQALGLAGAAIGNSVHRGVLQASFQRVIFSSHGADDLALHLPGFATRHAPLDAGNAHRALHASGSIPFVLTGERDIPGAPAGQYWDGGIVDYHFDLRHHAGDGLLLYPHFGPAITPGWFDKFLPWRRQHPQRFDHLVLLCPSPAFLARLPRGKIPDRGDFKAMKEKERVAYWEQSVRESERLGDELRTLVSASDPLAAVEPLPLR